MGQANQKGLAGQHGNANTEIVYDALNSTFQLNVYIPPEPEHKDSRKRREEDWVSKNPQGVGAGGRMPAYEGLGQTLRPLQGSPEMSGQGRTPIFPGLASRGLAGIYLRQYLKSVFKPAALSCRGCLGFW